MSLDPSDKREAKVRANAKIAEIEQGKVTSTMAIAGHISRDMLERYSHIRVEAKRAALEALSSIKPEGNGTVYGTIDQNVPVYSDLSPMNVSEGGQKKLEVATVP